MLLQPGDAFVGHIFGEMISLIVWRFDCDCVFHQSRFPLRCFSSQKTIEVVEAVAGGPVSERTHRGRLISGSIVPLSEGRCLVAIVLQDLGHRCGGLWHNTCIAVPVHCSLGDRAAADSLVIAPGQQRRASW